MRRGELYRVYKGMANTVTCAPIYSAYDGLSTQVRVGTGEGLKYGLAELRNALLAALELA